jgi:hypothetical protein
VKRGGLLQENPCFLSRKGRAQKNGVLGESLAAINGQQGEDWGKSQGLIPKHVKRKYLPLELNFLRVSLLTHDARVIQYSQQRPQFHLS